MPADRPWSPAVGKTALYVVASNATRVLCAYKEHPETRTLWSAEGRLLAQGNRSLTLDARLNAPAAPPVDEADRAALLLLPVWPGATLANLADYAALAPDKMLVRLVALERRGLITASAESPRHWALTPSGEAALRATEPNPAPQSPKPDHFAGVSKMVPPPAAIPKPPAKPVQMSLF